MSEASRDSLANRPEWDAVIIGAGPIGLACAMEAKRRGQRALILEKGCLVNSIFRYPTHMRFFSTSNLLEIGGVPFATVHEKPAREEALEYYRRAAKVHELTIRLYEKVREVRGEDNAFDVISDKGIYRARKVIAAIGFFEIPRLLHVPGEDLDKVAHYYREPHSYADQDVLIVGSGNSAAIAALECFRHGVRVTMAVRGENFHDSIKYWIRPDLDNRLETGEITAHYNTRVVAIYPDRVMCESKERGAFELKNDFVLALTGYEPDYAFLQMLGVEIGTDEFRTPVHDPETYETHRKGLYLAGVVVGGMKTNMWFIENSRLHAVRIFDHIEGACQSKEAVG